MKHRFKDKRKTDKKQIYKDDNEDNNNNINAKKLFLGGNDVIKHKTE
jgi:hypothetical protein